MSKEKNCGETEVTMVSAMLLTRNDEFDFKPYHSIFGCITCNDLRKPLPPTLLLQPFLHHQEDRTLGICNIKNMSKKQLEEKFLCLK